MRTLGEIIDAALNGERPGYDELRYALCAMQSLSFFDKIAIEKLAEAQRENKRSFLVYSAVFQHKESLNRRRQAMAKSPEDFLGWENNPDNPECQSRRVMANKLFEKALEKTKTGYMGDIAGVGCDPSTV